MDASFAAHPDCKSQTGATGSFEDGKGAAQPVSRKQRLNTKSSAKSELVGVNDASVMILWTKLLVKEQGDEIERSALCQDNNSAALLEGSGKKSSGKKT